MKKRKCVPRSQEHLDFMVKLGQRMRKIRLQKGIKQKEFAKLIECSEAIYCRFENGKQGISLYSFYLACKVLGKDANSLLGRKRKMIKGGKNAKSTYQTCRSMHAV